MTRGQYIAMCAIGFIAVLALVQGLSLQQRLSGGSGLKRSTTTLA